MAKRKKKVEVEEAVVEVTVDVTVEETVEVTVEAPVVVETEAPVVVEEPDEVIEVEAVVPKVQAPVYAAPVIGMTDSDKARRKRYNSQN